MRALVSHQRGPGSNPGVNAKYGLSLLMALSLAPRGLTRVLKFSALLKNQHFQFPIRCGTHGKVKTSSQGSLVRVSRVNKITVTN